MKIKMLMAIVITIFFLGCSDKSGDVEDFSGYKVGEIVTLNGVEGGKRELKRVEKGFVLKEDEQKIVIFDIFGTFCPPCQKEAPHLTKFQIENSDKIVIIGLTFLEEVTDSYVVDNFSNKYNGHYFISNSKENEKIIETILDDIEYPVALQLPFKVVLKKGVYQELTDVWEGKKGGKFYLGDIGIETIKKDIDRIAK